ncbi:mechanosensitive ion channel-like protein [Hyaloscypha variabilis F]|uniref:Mechanosensitive ion channel-like protein n=1 Tax=Hyaloscypha variabilis (strain UAMH 11265 / GT02V1 / F) TaxID=1149755 RepID=A0A2J6RTJ6_HYAVF|nr:mechanosensitive ion channel-like protein [Hyaloscypha variabilis F]
MSSPTNEKEQYSFPAFEPNLPTNPNPQDWRSSDEDGTLQGEGLDDITEHNTLRVYPSYAQGQDNIEKDSRTPMSPAAQREQSRRLDDDLEMLRAERVVSSAERSNQESTMGRSRSMMARSRSRTNVEPEDDFDVGTTPIHEKTKIYQPPANPTTRLARFFKKVHQSSFLVRWFVYITPLTLLLLIPLLFGIWLFPQTTVGGVQLLWFGIWLEIVWLTLWAGRLLAKSIPYPMGLISSLFTNSSKKWRDLGKALEVPATLFFWLLAIEVSFLPTMKNHHLDGNKATRNWEIIVNKIIVSIFVGACLNFFEKIIIQLIAISFHLRTYADRIEVNKFQISSLVKLYIYSKEKIQMEDSEFEPQPSGPASGARTPMAYVNKAQKNARHVFNKVGDVAGKVAGDFTGQAVKTSTHPHQVILQLLNSTAGSQVLARRLYRTFAHEDSETVLADDLRPAFDNDDEADAAFTMFDKDLNGDISMEELEAVCVEIGRERKAITASLKDLDSVVSKLDSVFLFIVAVITILVFISLISTSASGVLTSAGSTVLALSWLFSATAQEFLQSCIFVFVKHPFDVGDRVTIYGNTGSQMKGDDYFVKEISLLYTEFKKMEGHVVQAPNTYLNTLFILNQRRSGGLAEAVPVTVKFGTTLEQIEELRNRLLEFVGSENREYQKNILTELTTIYEAYSITLNVVFFYKSNWQNELLRLQRRNKFICAMMVSMHELGIEGPRQRLAGQSQEFPVFLNNAYPNNQPSSTNDTFSPGPGPRSGSLARDPPFVAPESSSQPLRSQASIFRNRGSSSLRQRGESISAMGKRVDFSLGMSAISSGADFGDVYEDREPKLPPQITTTSPSPGPGRIRASEDNNSLARTNSKESGMGKVMSNSSSQKTHKNRFFGRTRGRSKLGNAEEGTDLTDLEAGTRDFGVEDLPDIPEASGANTVSWGDETKGSVEEARRGEQGGGGGGGDGGTGRIDPRTGIVSPQAVTRDSARERGELPFVDGRGVRRAVTEQVRRR